MQGDVQPVVMIPRFTSYVGQGDSTVAYDTAALEVSDFDRLILTVGAGKSWGGGDCTVVIQDSHDGIVWYDLDTLTYVVDTTVTSRVDLTRRWLRVRVLLDELLAITMWASGQLVRRMP